MPDLPPKPFSSKGRMSFSKTAEKRLHPILPTPAETEKIWRVLLQEGVGQHLKRTETWRGEAGVPGLWVRTYIMTYHDYD